MNYLYKLISISCVCLFATTSGLHAQYEPKNIDEQEILTTFANYKYGYEQFKAESIVKNLSAASQRFFDSVLYHIHYSDSATIASLPVSAMILVLDGRIKAREKLAQAQNTADLINIFLNYGIMREEMERQIVNILIKDSTALCAALMPSSTMAKDYNFVKENDYWKVDLNTEFSESDRSFKALLNNEELMKKYKLTPSTLYKQIFDKLGIPSGHSPAWEPVLSNGK